MINCSTHAHHSSRHVRITWQMRKLQDLITWLKVHLLIRRQAWQQRGHKSGGGQKTKSGWSQNLVAWSPASQVKCAAQQQPFPPKAAREKIAAWKKMRCLECTVTADSTSREKATTPRAGDACVPPKSLRMQPLRLLGFQPLASSLAHFYRLIELPTC